MVNLWIWMMQQDITCNNIEYFFNLKTLSSIEWLVEFSVVLEEVSLLFTLKIVSGNYRL